MTMTRTKAIVLALVIVGLVLCVTLGLFVLAAIGSGAKVNVAKGSILVVDLTRPLSEKGSRQPGLAGIFGNLSHPLPAYEAASAVRAAGDDERIAAILLRGGFEGSFASLDLLREALVDARKSGKRIYAQLGSANERMLWLGSAADEIWLDPLGFVEFDGWFGDILYFGDALKELGVEVQVTRVGKYKSAVEPFMLGRMTDENREQLTEMMRSIEGKILGDIGEARGLDVEQLKKWSRERGWFTAKAAVEEKLATHSAPYASLLEKLREHADVDAQDELPEITLSRYARGVRKSPGSGPGVRVVVADGEIVDGSNPMAIGGDDLAEELRAAREDEDTLAVVMRVDSPGGSATASDVIRAEVLALKAAGKPVIVSMGSLAASGGYWISANADVIVAQPQTLTGSIGVFGMLPNVEALAEKYGLRAERVSTSPLAGLGSMWKRLDETQIGMVQGIVDEIYERFLDLVAEGRKLGRDRVHEIAQGRVWTGTRAHELGLVDELGDLDRAIEIALERAHLESDAPVRYPEREMQWLDELLEELLEQEGLAQSRVEHLRTLARFARLAQALEQLEGKPAILARLPFEVIVH
jgi:protease-4